MILSKKDIEVRYAETDQMGIVYHANYVIWMEIGRTALIEELGFRYADMEKDGILSPVLEINAQYKKPVKYGEVASVHTWIEEYDGVRVTYGYEIYNGDGDLSVIGYSKHACVKKENFRPVSMRKYFPTWHEAYLKTKKA